MSSHSYTHYYHVPQVNSVVTCVGNYWGDHGWRRGDSDDNRAKVAYDALLRVGLYESKSQLFEEFAVKVKRRAKVDYGFDYDKESEEVS